ncbi:hypothetical protein Golax_004565 [Gossypium laxum]|uniref:RNase H type-1 domain-containing protein n=1 Tax=Gossypium laxum TaxID=34288 RepID=A0A7J9B421_9ROSI|nr:hypothetical protein [Gossypium laxum]
MYKRVGRFELRSDVSRGKNPKEREKLRRRDEIEVNQVSAIQKSQRGHCENGWERMSRARSGFGVVARNSSGEMLASMVVCHKAIPSLFAAEAHACYQALRLGVRPGLDSIVIEGDSLTIIKKCRSANIRARHQAMESLKKGEDLYMDGAILNFV